MPYFIKIDFREEGTLVAWHNRDQPQAWKLENMHTNISESRIRDVLIALADELDPLDAIEQESPDGI